jgi:ATP-dependent DNA helicase
LRQVNQDHDSGKTIQIISLIAKIREEGGYGPHLIIAPLSTLSNWESEFENWTPDIPVVKYHGTPAVRETIRKQQIMNHLKSTRDQGKLNKKPTKKFPVVITSYEILKIDAVHLNEIKWWTIIIVRLRQQCESELD